MSCTKRLVKHVGCFKIILTSPHTPSTLAVHSLTPDHQFNSRYVQPALSAPRPPVLFINKKRKLGEKNIYKKRKTKKKQFCIFCKCICCCIFLYKKCYIILQHFFFHFNNFVSFSFLIFLF